MTQLEAIIVNIFTGKTFVKNSWPQESKNDLQQFFANSRIITQNKNNIDCCSSPVAFDQIRYSIYEGEYKSLQFKTKRERLKELETEIKPLYDKFQEYERLKKELNL